MTKKERYDKITTWFSANMPSAQTELEYTTVWNLLVAVMLSAQCTDKRVNMVTPSLIAAFPTPQDMAQSSPEEIFSYIRSISYPNAKANHLHQTAIALTERHRGEIPSVREELEALPGVGRKTANVILSVAFDQPAMAVDTHVFRVANRIGLSEGKTPLKVEQDLMKGFNNNIIPLAHHWLILHGRYVCLARKPKCEQCGIAQYCKFFILQK